jgi:hypothetical protein
MDVDRSNFYIGTEINSILFVNLSNQKILKKHTLPHPGNVLGTSRIKNYLFVSAGSYLYKIDLNQWKIIKDKIYAEAKFHHNLIYNDKIYNTITKNNQILITDLNYENEKKINIKPPKNKKVAYKSNYNHLNNVFFKDEKCYVNLNWLKSQYSDSGYAVLDKEFNELERIKYGWQTHSFQIINEKRHVLSCYYANQKNVKHPKKAGLMIEGDLVWEWDLSYFCKWMIYHNNYYFIFGGKAVDRDKRKHSDGVIFILDNKYKEIDKQIYNKTGNFGSACL